MWKMLAALAAAVLIISACSGDEKAAPLAEKRPVELEEFGETIGLNFDPSHLIWLMIDIESAILEFGERFYHFQAKDVMIDYEGLYDNGSLSSGIGWQIPRLPGLGHVDWGVVFNALYRVGYDGPIIIEHEDRGFEATDELVKRGFLLARDVLAPYVH